MTPHECYACEALTEAEVIQEKDKREAVKRKAESEEEPQEHGTIKITRT